MTGILNLLMGVGGALKDTYFNLVSLLLPGNGTNGAQNNTFLDASTNNFTITRNGNTTQGTFSPFSQTGWGAYFDGTSDYLGISGNPANNLSTGTFEFWVYLNSISSVPIFTKQRDGIGTWAAVSIGSYVNSVGNWATGTAGKIYFHSANGVTEAASTGTISANTWVHVAIVFSASDCKFYINGTLDSTVSGDYSIPTDNSPTWTRISSQPTGTTSVNGYISNFRFSNIARTISLPTSPYTSDANTLLLTCQSNRFIDNSSNAFTITPSGNTSVQAFSPFNPLLPWTAANNGGSGYFDGASDYLTVADNASLELGSSNFTLETWVYVTAAPSGLTGIFAKGGSPYGGFYLGYNASRVVKLYASTTSSTWDIANDVGAQTLSLNAWNHVAISRNGSSWRIWVNGTSGSSDTVTSSSAVWNTANAWYIGSNITGAENFTGYMASARFVIGSYVYDPASTTLTIPTAPLTNITNTSILLNFTNAGIYDATSKNDLETVGNAQISTAQSKWGGGSMYFDGTGDYLASPNSSLFQFGTGDFTVEMWLYTANVSSDQSLIDVRAASTASSWGIFIDNTGKPYWYDASGAQTSSTSLSSNTWTHLAITRSGTTLRIFLAGTQTYSGSNSNSQNATGVFYIGRNYPNTVLYTGYIDDLRITKGYARYTANFTAPTAPFPLQ